MKKARCVVALAIALALTLVLAGASGFVAWRRTQPRWRLPPEDSRWEVAFADQGRIVRTQPHGPGLPQPSTAFGIEDGRDLGSHGVEGHVTSPFEPGWGGSGELVDFSEDKVWLEDLERGTSRLIAHAPRLTTALLSPDRALVAIVTSKTHVAIGVVSPEPLAPPFRALEDKPDVSDVTWLRFSPRADRLACDCRINGNRGVQVWSVPTGRVCRRLLGTLASLTAANEVVILRDDGDCHVAGNPHELSRLVLVPEDGPERTLASVFDHAFDISLDGARVASFEGDAVSNAVVVRSLETGAVVRRIPQPRRREIRTVALSPGGDCFLVAGVDGSVELWDLPP